MRPPECEEYPLPYRRSTTYFPQSGTLEYGLPSERNDPQYLQSSFLLPPDMDRHA